VTSIARAFFERLIARNGDTTVWIDVQNVNGSQHDTMRQVGPTMKNTQKYLSVKKTEKNATVRNYSIMPLR
jgi:hypothetical protein